MVQLSLRQNSLWFLYRCIKIQPLLGLYKWLTLKKGKVSFLMQPEDRKTIDCHKKGSSNYLFLHWGSFILKSATEMAHHCIITDFLSISISFTWSKLSHLVNFYSSSKNKSKHRLILWTLEERGVSFSTPHSIFKPIKLLNNNYYYTSFAYNSAFPGEY